MKENKFYKQFIGYEQKSNDALSTFEIAVQRLRSQNEQLVNLHANVDEEIERLKELKNNIAERIATNDNAIQGLKNIIS